MENNDKKFYISIYLLAVEKKMVNISPAIWLSITMFVYLHVTRGKLNSYLWQCVSLSTFYYELFIERFYGYYVTSSKVVCSSIGYNASRMANPPLVILSSRGFW